jgi:phenylacetate-CoA ligase
VCAATRPPCVSLGRLSDSFRTSSGKIVPGEYFIHLIGVVLNDGSIERFQVIQHSYDHVTVKIVRLKGHNQIDLTKIVDKIRLVMDLSCTVIVEFVDDIPPSASGKYLYTVSEVLS